MNIIRNDPKMFRDYLARSEIELQLLQSDDFSDELAEMRKMGCEIQGAKLPWGVTHSDLRFRGGEVTVWMGINGHGKSLLLGQACLGFVRQGEGVCLASFEMRPVMSLHRMVTQIAHNDKYPDAFIRKVTDWLGDRFWFFNQTGEVDAESLRGVIAYAAKELKIKHFVIDSLMMVVKGDQGENAMNGQKNFVGQLCRMAKDLNIHIHLVHHSRKLVDENQVPGKFDAKGNGAITDQVDQVLTVWRNRAKERAMDKNRLTGRDDPETEGKPDALLVCDKNRHGGQERQYALWFHGQSQQYVASPRVGPIEFMEGA